MQLFRYFFSMLLFLQIFNFSYTLHAKEEWQRVYLATYPRSGNHWTRGLLEEATHIATSAVYQDKEPLHLKDPFPWGGYAAENGYEGNCRYPNPGEVVIIKTHFPAKRKTQFDLKPAVKIIRIVRYPLDAFYSHYIKREKVLPADGKIPSSFARKSIQDWYQFENYWNQQPNVLTIRYEDLFENPYLYFKQILTAAGYTLGEEDIERALHKFPPRGELFKHSKDYHPADLEIAYRMLGKLMKKYDYPTD